MDPIDVREPRLWCERGWTAKVIPNDDGDGGWAVEMTRDGDPDPALVGPWVMGRDKKNPKPLNPNDFATLVKTATEVLMRHEQQARAAMHSRFVYARDDGQRVWADLDLVPDEDDPHAILACSDARTGEPLRAGRVAVGFKMNAVTVEAFLTGDRS